jgi:hypothetical protein
MSKPLFVISSPFDTYSGYGARSRDLIKAVIDSDKYNVRLLSQRWGNTPFGFIKDNNKEWGFLEKLILPQGQIPRQPEIWMQITVPEEFQPVGKYNIGVTAGVETTICPPQLIEGCNRMNLILASSNHAKDVILNSKFDGVNQQTNQKIKVEFNKPIEVLFEGVNTNIYKPEETRKLSKLDNIKEEFCYLAVGHWMQGDLGEDRKNIGLVIKSFYETFKNKTKKPALILKTSQVGSSYIDREDILRKIASIKKTMKTKNLPNIYLLNGELTDEEMSQLYNHPKVKAMISLTKGEGFGRPLLEFSLVKKPIIVSGWSGHLDFMDKELSILLGGQLTPVHPSAANQYLIKESQWFSPDPIHIGHFLKDVYENYKNYIVKAKKLGTKNKNEFSREKMAEKIHLILNKHLPEFPKQVQLKLPQLKKIELPKIKKIETDAK